VKIYPLVLANIFLFATVTLYFINIIKKGVTPNPATFFVRTGVGFMNCVSYFAVVEKDYFKISSLIISTIGMFLIFFYSLWKGKLTKLRTIDVICGISAIIIGIIWKTTGNSILANLLLQSIMLLAFYPAIDGVRKGIAKEKALPWIFATVSYVFMTIAIIGNGWEAFIHPVISGIIGNGSLALVIWGHKK
jgi:hypothetical protein